MSDLSIFDKFPGFFPKQNRIKDAVIAINTDGRILEGFLEEKPYNHAVLTCYMALKFHLPYIETTFPYVAGNHLSKHGVLVLHVHNSGIMMCFFPKHISQLQYDSFKRKLETSEIESFGYDVNQEGFISKEEILMVAKGLIQTYCVNPNCYHRKRKIRKA